MTPGIGSSARRLTVTIALTTALVNASPVHAQEQDEAFKAGLNARKDSNWTAVAGQMRLAIDADAQESTRKIGSFWRVGGTEYLPYFFLGEALFNLGRCGEALNAWERSEDQGVVQKVREHHDRLREGYKACEARGVLLRQQYRASLAGSRQQVEEVTRLAREVSALGNKHLVIWRADITLESRYKTAEAEINRARDTHGSAERTRLRSEFTQVGDLTDRANKTLDQLKAELDDKIRSANTIQDLTAQAKQRIGELEQLVTQVQTRRLPKELQVARDNAEQTRRRATTQYLANPPTEASLRGAIDAAREASGILKHVLTEIDALESLAAEQRFARVLAAARRHLTSIDDDFTLLASRMTERPGRVPQEDLDAAAVELRRLKRSVANAEQKRDLAAVERASTSAETGLLPRLTEMLERFGPVTLEDRGVPGWLQSGVSLFFQGEYDKSLAELDSKTAPGSSQLHVHLFRAAARHALFVRSGETNQAHRTRALAEIDDCKLIDPDFQPDTRAFSPRFLAFYQNGTAPEAQP